MKKKNFIKIFLISLLTLTLTLIPYNAKANTAEIYLQPILYTGQCNINPDYLIKFNNIPKEQLKNVKVTIADTTIAEVERIRDSEIVVKRKKLGKTTITIELKYKNKIYSDTKELVSENATRCYNTKITGINNIKIGETTQLTLEYPRGSTIDIVKLTANPDLNWTSSNPNIATINSSGQVTGISAGTTTITANYKLYDGSIKVTTYIMTVSATHTPSTPNNTPNTNPPTNNNNINNNSNTAQNNNHQEEITIENNNTNNNLETIPNQNDKTMKDNPTTFERIKQNLQEYKVLIYIIFILLGICVVLKIIQANLKSTNK